MPARPGLSSVVMVVPLTSRERDIATLAAQGESSKAIAARLFLSVRTVNNHLQSVYSKLGVTGRAPARRRDGAGWRQLAGDPFKAPAIIVSADEVVGERPRLLDLDGPAGTERRGE